MDLAYAPAPEKKRAIRFLLATGVLALTAYAVYLYIPHAWLRLAVFGAIAAIAGLAAFVYPRYSLYLGVFYVYAGLSFFASLPVVPALTFLTTAAVLLGLLGGDSFEMTDRLFNWSLAVFTVFAIQSFIFSYDHRYSLISFAAFAKSVLMVLLIAQLVRTGKHLETLAFVVFGAALASVILGAVALRLGMVQDWMKVEGGYGWQRFGATHVNPNEAAMYLVAGVPLGMYAVKRARSILARVLLVICVIVVLMGLVATLSRMTIFPLVICLLAVLFREAHSKWVYGIVVVAAVVGLGLVPGYYWHRISTISQLLGGSGGDFSLAIRFEAVKVGWHLFLEHPFTGVGLNNFIVRAVPELHAAIGSHNGYMEILSGVGIFGFTAFILMPISAIRGFARALKAPWPEDERWMKDLSFYSLLSAIAVFVVMFFGHNQFYRVFWVSVAAGVVAGKVADRAGKLADRTGTIADPSGGPGKKS